MGKMVRSEIQDFEVWLEGGGGRFMGNWKARGVGEMIVTMGYEAVTEDTSSSVESTRKK